MSGIAAVIFKQDMEKGARAYAQIEGMVHDQLIRLETATTAVRNESGKVSLGETHDWTSGKRLRRGGFWGVLLGLAFAGPLIGLAAGLGLGAFIGKRKKDKQKSQFVQDLADNLEPGDSAVFVSFDQMHRPDVLEMLNKLGGVVIADELSAEDEAALMEALEKKETEEAIKHMKREQRHEAADVVAEEGISNIQ